MLLFDEFFFFIWLLARCSWHNTMFSTSHYILDFRLFRLVFFSSTHLFLFFQSNNRLNNIRKVFMHHSSLKLTNTLTKWEWICLFFWYLFYYFFFLVLCGVVILLQWLLSLFFFFFFIFDFVFVVSPFLSLLFRNCSHFELNCCSRCYYCHFCCDFCCCRSDFLVIVLRLFANRIHSQQFTVCLSTNKSKLHKYQNRLLCSVLFYPILFSLSWGCCWTLDIQQNTKS